MNFLEASGLYSSWALALLNSLWCCFWHGYLGVCSKMSPKMSFWNASRRLLFIGVCGWVSNTWWSLIRGAWRLFLQDTWHLLIGRNVLIFKVTHVSTRLDCLCHSLHTPGCICHFLQAPMCDWFLHACYVFISTTLGKFLLVFE